jgi:hypothetical protein
LTIDDLKEGRHFKSSIVNCLLLGRDGGENAGTLITEQFEAEDLGTRLDLDVSASDVADFK